MGYHRIDRHRARRTRRHRSQGCQREQVVHLAVLFLFVFLVFLGGGIRLRCPQARRQRRRGGCGCVPATRQRRRKYTLQPHSLRRARRPSVHAQLTRKRHIRVRALVRRVAFQRLLPFILLRPRLGPLPQRQDSAPHTSTKYQGLGTQRTHLIGWDPPRPKLPSRTPSCCAPSCSSLCSWR